MNWIKPPRLEWYAFIFTMPIISIVLNLILFEEQIWIEKKIWFISIPLVFMMGLISWYIHIRYDAWAERKYPGLHQSKQRILVKSAALILILPPVVLLFYFVYANFHILGYYSKPVHLVWVQLVGLSVNLVFATLYETDFVLKKYRESVEEKEILRQLSVQQEFDTLKSQVNPHFLFNCFNTLSSLITEDKRKADIFLNELSKVYRYLLRNNEEGLSTLENEIKFIRSYYKLLQTRHGEAVHLSFRINDIYNNFLLPSLSLQLLVENAVKHNSISRKHPLYIEIYTTEGDKLVVRNNLQLRTVKVPSNKVGLTNIQSKYALLEQDGLQIIQDENYFVVILPLLWKQSGYYYGSKHTTEKVKAIIDS